jgi:hypothetical protein
MQAGTVIPMLACHSDGPIMIDDGDFVHISKQLGNALRSGSID